ncbi:hypothetical protein ACH42_06545 [Endozoicomonas sp. (ex Bugula neritina AB1)]|nr:hypothetical protein ACH42_06545 [Endozoicomonas sp. (ex Bugula neritina AB1)]
MRVLVVYAHPNPESFNNSIQLLVCSELKTLGHEVELLDLYQNNFNPCMSREERASYMSKDNTRPVEPYVQQLQKADALVMVYPTWWMGPPAILKGWLDRVWLPSVVAEIGPNGVAAKLTNIKKILIITTQGSSGLRMNLLGNPPKLMMKACLKICTKSKEIDWMALYKMDKIDNAARVKFLNKIQAKLHLF